MKKGKLPWSNDFEFKRGEFLLEESEFFMNLASITASIISALKSGKIKTPQNVKDKFLKIVAEYRRKKAILKRHPEFKSSMKDREWRTLWNRSIRVSRNLINNIKNHFNKDFKDSYTSEHYDNSEDNDDEWNLGLNKWKSGLRRNTMHRLGDSEDKEWKSGRLRRRNPTISCPSCGAGNKADKSVCWKCNWEFVPSAKPVFGKSLKRPGFINNPGTRLLRSGDLEPDDWKPKDWKPEESPLETRKPRKPIIKPFKDETPTTKTIESEYGSTDDQYWKHGWTEDRTPINLQNLGKYADDAEIVGWDVSDDPLNIQDLQPTYYEQRPADLGKYSDLGVGNITTNFPDWQDEIQMDPEELQQAGFILGTAGPKQLFRELNIESFQDSRTGKIRPKVLRLFNQRIADLLERDPQLMTRLGQLVFRTLRDIEVELNIDESF